MIHCKKIFPCGLVEVTSPKVAIDQYPSEDFNIGFSGRPANDLTLLERAQSMSEVQLVLSRLQQYKANNPNVDKTDKEIIAEIVPRWVQSPSEIDRFMDYYYQNVVEPKLGAKPVSVEKDVVKEAFETSIASPDVPSPTE